MRRVVGVLLTVMSAFCLAASGAGAVRITDRQAISGFSPFKPGGCGVPGQPTFDSEAEPALAVNPRNPRNVVAVWQQDRFAVDGGALSNIVAVSKNGGRSWRRVLVPGISRCTGGTDERTSDPWLSIGPDGRVYLASLTFTDNPVLAAGGLAGPTNQLVSTSTNGGLTWSPPTTVVANGHYNDREQIAADPTIPRTAYEIWVDRLGLFGETGVEKLVRTHNGGRSFGSPSTPYSAAPTNLPDPPLIVPLPDGTLVNVFMLANISAVVGPPVPFKVMAMYSRNRGATWSTPKQIAQVPPQAPYDPDTNVQVRAFPVVSAAVGPDGAVYAVWNDIRSEKSSRILMSRSLNDGKTWGKTTTVRSIRSQAFLPSVAVDGHGTIGVLWDDFRHDVPHDKALTTDVWFAGSTNGGKTFKETHVSGPFNAASAPPTSSTGVSGHFLGDYQGFAAFPSGFGALFGQSGHTHGPSDVFFAHIHVPSAVVPAVQLSVRPHRVAAARRIRVRFTARSSLTRRALQGVLVRFAHRRARTGRNGQAEITVTLRQPGRYVAVGSLRRLRSGHAAVLALGAPPPPPVGLG